jgi:GrpB-like predicted nucleotidyltransferase (UPF0157 family)
MCKRPSDSRDAGYDAVARDSKQPRGRRPYREKEIARHLRLRDHLRANPRLASEYASLKRTLADRMPDDREGYTAAKTAFIRRAERLEQPC